MTPEKVVVSEESDARQLVALPQFAELIFPIIGPVVALFVVVLTSISTILPGEDVLETLETLQAGQQLPSPVRRHVLVADFEMFNLTKFTLLSTISIKEPCRRCTLQGKVQGLDIYRLRHHKGTGIYPRNTFER